MRNFTFTRFNKTTEQLVECTVEEASWLYVEGEGKVLPVEPETSQNWNRVRGFLYAFFDTETFGLYEQVEPGLVVYSRCLPLDQDPFACNIGYISAAYKGNLAVAPTLAEYPSGWAVAYMYGGIITPKEIRDTRTEEEKLREDQVWGSYMPQSVYVTHKMSGIMALATGRPIQVPINTKPLKAILPVLLAQYANTDKEAALEDRNLRIAKKRTWTNVISPAYRKVQQDKVVEAEERAANNGGVAVAYAPPAELKMYVITKDQKVEMRNIMEVDPCWPYVTDKRGRPQSYGQVQWDPANEDSIKTFQDWAALGYRFQIN